MGCTQSKIENEEAVARCKERKHIIKDAVSARNAFAAAHSAYAAYLKNSGAALSDFSQGEALSSQSSQLLFPIPPNSSSPNPNSSIQPPPPFEIIPPPPPPPAAVPPAPLYRAATMPEMLAKPQLEHVDTIVEEDEINELENEGSKLRRRKSNRGSNRGVIEEDGGGDNEMEDDEGSLNSRLRRRRNNRGSNRGVVEDDEGGGHIELENEGSQLRRRNSNRTNRGVIGEDGGGELLRRRRSDRGGRGGVIEEEEGDGDDDDDELENEGGLRSRMRRRGERGSRGGNREVFGEEEEEDGEEIRPPAPPPKLKPAGESRTVPPPPQPQQHPAFEYFFPQMENTPGPSLGGVDEVGVGVGKEEIVRKEVNERKEGSERKKKDVVRGGDGGGVVEEKAAENVVVEPVREAVVVAAQNGKGMKKGKQGQVSIVEGKIVKQKVNLIQIFNDIDDHFLKASESAHEVSKMLEATRMHYHSNFADNRGHIDHSARVMRVITWNRSFRGMPNLDDGKDDLDFEGHETHATVLDKLLAWEKKLYDEVKAGELMKFEYQRKVASLNKLKKRGKSSDALERAKAAVSHLHTRYIVDMQSMDSTVSEINRLRDEQLYPRLVQLVDGMATMWGIMHMHHEKQSNIALALASLDDSQSPKMTTEHHHDRTYQLLVVVQEWHSQFDKLMSNQRKYIKALNNWLKLNLVPIESNLKEKVSSPPRVINPPIRKLLLAWQEFMEKLPDEVARSAISNFAAVIDTIFHQQAEELHLKQKCEETQKELARKKRHFEDWYRKYMEKKIPDDPDPDKPHESFATDEVVTEKQHVVDQVKMRLEDEEEAYARQCHQVRQKSLVSLKNRLPELFRNMSDFALECSKMYSELRYISQNLNTGQRSP